MLEGPIGLELVAMADVVVGKSLEVRVCVRIDVMVDAVR